MRAVKRVVEGKMSLTRALKYCGVSRQAYYYKKRPVKPKPDVRTRPVLAAASRARRTTTRRGPSRGASTRPSQRP